MLVLLLLLLLALISAGWRLWKRTQFFLHIFQLEGYKQREYAGWITGRPSLLFRTSHALGAVIWIGALLLLDAAPLLVSSIAAGLWIVAFASARRYMRSEQKKPLAYTARLKRLIATAVSIEVALVVLGVWLFAASLPLAALGLLAGLFAADLLAPWIVYLAGALMRPVERSVHRGFIRQANERLASRPDLELISITGSYGKTSTKFVIAEILKQRYSVLATPGSYNTPMGLCLVINQKLKPEHQILVLEMGIRHPGDMEELLEVARPQTGVVTTIGLAHLETMGSQEAIAHEKGKMIAGMQSGGTVVLNVDDERVAAMAERAPEPERIWRISLEDHPEADITASEITYGRDGAHFTVRDETGATAEFQTLLLGRHNVLNILLGVAVGRSHGLRLRQIAHAVRRLEPVEHRLELREDGGVTVIDDAFNSNPVGARNAVEILGAFDGGRRVIVTPGMIELGERQEKENRTLGRHIAKHADLAVLVGREQTAPIQRGLKEADYPSEQMKVVDTLFEAQELLRTYLREGDVVLYENDLPDQYDV